MTEEIKNKGGIFVGGSHDEGGIPLTVKETGQHIEVEGREPLIPNEVIQKDEVIEVKGTNKKILNELNKSVGAKGMNEKATEVHAGDFIICKKSANDETPRKIIGTPKQIVSAVNASCGCKHLYEGAVSIENGKKIQYQSGGNIKNENNMENLTEEQKNHLEKLNSLKLEEFIEKLNELKYNPDDLPLQYKLSKHDSEFAYDPSFKKWVKIKDYYKLGLITDKKYFLLKDKINQILDKYSVAMDEIQAECGIGFEMEKEHIDTAKLLNIKDIPNYLLSTVLDHLIESFNYYKNLPKFEEELRQIDAVEKSFPEHIKEIFQEKYPDYQISVSKNSLKQIVISFRKTHLMNEEELNQLRERLENDTTLMDFKMDFSKLKDKDYQPEMWMDNTFRIEITKDNNGIDLIYANRRGPVFRGKYDC